MIRNNYIDLRNLSVCIVGNAAYMKNKKMGKHIDTFDRVARINLGINIINVDDFGCKTHMAMVALSNGKIESIVNCYENIYENNRIKKHDIISVCKSRKIEYLIAVSVCVNSNERMRWLDHFSKVSADELKYVINSDIYDKYLFGITSGISSIIYILSCKPKSVYICGFSCKLDIHTDYKKYHMSFSKRAMNGTYDDQQKNWHSTKFELYILKNLFLKYKFETDDVMCNMLNNIDTSSMNNDMYIGKFKGIHVEYKYENKMKDIYKLIDNGFKM